MVGRVAITDMALPLNTPPGVAYFLNLGWCSVKLPVSLLRPDLVCSLMKWYLTFICFVLQWFLSFTVFEIDPALTRWIITGLLIGRPTLSSNLLSYMAWDVALVNAMYSALTIDNAMVSCHLLSQDTGPPAMMKIFPSIDCLWLFTPSKIWVNITNGVQVVRYARYSPQW